METKIFRKVPPNSRRKHRGVALILVLACVVLLTVMILAFLVSISSEVQSSKFYANGSSVKLLAQSATDLVMAEIRDATANGSYCWASQPGMIRTWDNTGTAKNYYKLYSDYAMVGTGAFDHTQTLVPDGTATVNGSTVAWYNQQGVYVDLNQPVSVNGVNQYPIVDGDLATVTGNSSDLSSVTFSTSNTTTPLPAIIKPTPTSNINTVKVLGAATVATGLPNGFWVNSLTPAQSTTSGNQAPMPVRWLYVLEDGSIAVPATDTAASTTVAFLTTDPVTNDALPTPSSTNPIVGRMAFWTDDETCKVNVNTASEGTYWDAPRANIWNGSKTQEEAMAENSPVQNEFQRYPGHPAMTSLSAVFNLPSTSLPSTSSPAPTLPSPSPETSTYLMTPRVGAGGSAEGTALTTQGASVSAITPNSNRLYATTDEYMFQPSLTGSAGSARNLNSAQTGASALTQTTLKQARFFITANSRAPDVNLFNQPRVSIWPLSINNNSTYRSAYDQLIAFCTTMRTDLSAPYLYYFQRQDSTDPNIDLPTTNDNTGLDRNRRLLEYLRYLTQQQIPGFGGSLASKYNTENTTSTGTDNDQILTEIFDYIRSTNLAEPGVTAYTAKYTTGVPTSSSGGLGQVIPIDDTTFNTHGFGRFRTVQGASLLFIANADGDVAASQPKTGQVAAGNRRIQAALLLQLFDPSVGAVWDYINLNANITGLDSFTAGGLSLGFNPSIAFHQAEYYTDNCFWGDQLGFRQFYLGTTFSSGSFVGSSVDLPNTGGSNGTGGTFSFSGGTITVNLLTGTGSTNPGTNVQTVQLVFPSATLPLPSLSPSNVNNWSYVPTWLSGPYNFRYFNTPPTLNTPNTASGPDLPGNNNPSIGGRLVTANQGGDLDSNSWVTKYDLVRSVSVPADPRLIAAQKNPASSLFAAVGSFTSSATLAVGMHSQFDGAGCPYYGGIVGKLVQSASYDNLGAATSNTFNGLVYTNLSATQPGGNGGQATQDNTADVFNPSTGSPLNGVTLGSTAAFTGAAGPPAQVLGDWDSGVGCVRDGPYINKADEGDSGTSSYHPYIWKDLTSTHNLTTTLFTPNRQIPSAVTFGSLPTGVFANRPWQTLLFRPGPLNHTGLGTSTTTPNTPTTTYGTDQGPPYTNTPTPPNTIAGPPDHLYLDLFTMPVVEPYAISEPLSTAGRINMNYLIVPFNYINRDTGLRAVLKSEQVISIADSQGTGYKVQGSPPTQINIRYPVNIDSTLSQFYSRRFNNKDIFRSPSEICDIDIVPSQNTAVSDPNPVSAATSLTPTRKAMDAYWNTATTGHRLTGDNARERIYATLYPRLTTKSNTFTIHFRVQTLKQALPTGSAASAWTQWREGTDVITGEYRGSQIIERYVDPNDTTIPDFAASPSTTQSLAPYYKFRVLSVKQFAP